MVDFKNLGAEELGSVYESLLELHPEVDAGAAVFELKVAAGSERKKTGSYYTPTSLISCLLDSALEPVLSEAVQKPDPEAAILRLKVVDPACGSGHFLIAAAHRMAKRLAAVRTGEEEPAPFEQHKALRDVIGHCIYGVDVNPMAVELCKVSLWMDALDPGKPLSFLEHRIQCGNSLLGATPALLREGIPDSAFNPIEGDDRAYCSDLKRWNKKEREGHRNLFTTEPWERIGNLTSGMIAIDQIDDSTIEGMHLKESRYREHVRSAGYLCGHLWADAWCAAFVWRKQKAESPLTEDAFRLLEKNPMAVPEQLRLQIQSIAREYQFFHWHLAFPEVFPTIEPSQIAKDRCGFDVVLGNPPWEKVNLKEQEWFALRSREIALAENAAARKRLITALQQSDPLLLLQFRKAVRHSEAEAHLLRNSGRYPLSGHGDINLYAVFAEQMITLISRQGRVGCIVQTDIATGDACKEFFGALMRQNTLVSLFDFVNTEGIFPAVHRTHPHFCLLTVSGSPQHEAPSFSFWNTNTSQLSDKERMFALTRTDLGLLNPNTGTCPIFRTEQDAELVKAIYRRVPVFRKEGASIKSWDMEVGRMLHSADDSHLFHPLSEISEEGSILPLYESKCFWQFDHRYATYGSEYAEVPDAKKEGPSLSIQTRYYARIAEIPHKYKSKISDWILAYRRITNTTNERTLVVSAIPKCGILDSSNIFFPVSKKPAVALLASLNSFVADFACRQSLGGTNLHVYILDQLPVPSLQSFEQPCPWDHGQQIWEWLSPRILELSYTSLDLQAFASEFGWEGPPFRWDPDRRFLIRCELDAALFHLYLPCQIDGTWTESEYESRDDLARLRSRFPSPRKALEYLLDTFPIVRRNDQTEHGEYRTKNRILQIYDAMLDAKASGHAYQSISNLPTSEMQASNAPGEVEPEVRPSLRVPMSLANISDGAWARPMIDTRSETGILLSALLKAMEKPLVTREIRIAAVLALEPKLLLPFLSEKQVLEWRRLVGSEADPVPTGVLSFTQRVDQGWSAAVRNLRANGHLIEDLSAGTWAPGARLDEFHTAGWPDGRASSVLAVLQEKSIDAIIPNLPVEVRAWIDAKAA